MTKFQGYTRLGWKVDPGSPIDNCGSPSARGTCVDPRIFGDNCGWSRIEDRGGGGREGEEGQDKNAGRNDRRDREDPGGGSVSSHRHTGNCGVGINKTKQHSLIIIDYQAKMTLIITIT